MAGIGQTPPPDLSWAKTDASRFNLPSRFALLAAGGAKHRPAKRWPAERFAALARNLAAKGIAPVLLGTQDDALAIQTVLAACPEAIDLSSRTSFADIACLARMAVACVGNDTGPMHLAAPGGRPCLVLFSSESNPALCAPRGGNVQVLQRSDLAALSVDEVISALCLTA
jgi:ADP-heptose:LPS heptosyltransferase